MSPGGRFEIKDGKRVRVQEPTRSHPEGDAPRDAKGHRLDRPSPKKARRQAKPTKPTEAKE